MAVALILSTPWRTARICATLSLCHQTHPAGLPRGLAEKRSINTQGRYGRKQSLKARRKNPLRWSPWPRASITFSGTAAKSPKEQRGPLSMSSPKGAWSCQRTDCRIEPSGSLSDVASEWITLTDISSAMPPLAQGCPHSFGSVAFAGP